MAGARKKYVTEAKLRLQEKIDSIQNNHREIVEFTEALVAKAVEPAQKLIKEKHKHQFMHDFMPVMQNLEACLNSLFLIRASLPESEDGTGTSDGESSESETNETVSTEIQQSVDSISVTSEQELANINDASIDESHDTLLSNTQESSTQSETPRQQQHTDTKTPLPIGENKTADEATVNPVIPTVPALAGPIQLQQMAATLLQGTPPQVQGNFFPYLQQLQALTTVLQGSQRAIPAISSGGAKVTEINTSGSATPTHVSGSSTPVNVSDNIKLTLPTAVSTPKSPSDSTTLKTTVQTKVEESAKKSKQKVQKQNLTKKPTSLESIPEDYGMGPGVEVMEFEDGNTIEVFVIEVETPWLFWAQPASPVLEDLNDQLALYNDSLLPGDPGFELTCPPKAGMVVCARYQDNSWFRACIKAVFSRGVLGTGDASQWLEVFYLDFGNKEIIDLSRVRPLPVRFAQLPCQVLPCALSEVGPPGGSTVWSQEQIYAFAGLVIDKGNINAIISTLPDCPLVFMELHRKDPVMNVQKTLSGGLQNVMFNIGERLVKTGYTVHITNEQIALTTEDIMRQEAKEPKDPKLESVVLQGELVRNSTPVIKRQKKMVSKKNPKKKKVPTATLR